MEQHGVRRHLRCDLIIFTAAIVPLTWEFCNGLEETEDR
jgi:hypothetical protein